MADSNDAAVLGGAAAPSSGTTTTMPHAADAWTVLMEPAAALLVPLLRGPELSALSLACKGLRPIWGQLCCVEYWSEGLARALESGE
jgi:hypothetical protein